VNKSLELLKAYDVDIPIVVEETFPLYSGLADYRNFLEHSFDTASG